MDEGLKMRQVHLNQHQNQQLTLFITVGSTKFDKLVNKALSEESISLLQSLNFKRLVIQAGQSAYSQNQLDEVRQKSSLEIDLYDYKPSIREDIISADIVIGHAGAGTCLEALRLDKRLIVVANDSLMDDHQSELAEQLNADQYVIQSSLDALGDNLKQLCRDKIRLRQFPKEEPSTFEEIFDDALRKVASRL